MFDMDTIKQIEDTLQVTLPEAYQKLLLSNPFANDPDPYGWEMYHNVNTIVGENLYHKDKDFFGVEWPPNYFVIGGDGFGNLYFLDLSRSDDVVFFADHDETSEDEGLSMYEETPSLELWIAQMREEKARVDAEDEDYGNRFAA